MISESTKASDFVTPEMSGEQIARELYSRRLRALRELSDEHPENHDA